jgi:hypothetical protein
MFLVRFFEGPFDREFVVQDTSMAMVPRVGESLTLRHPRGEESRYEVLAVDYLMDIRESISPVDELTGVRVQVRPI